MSCLAFDERTGSSYLPQRRRRTGANAFSRKKGAIASGPAAPARMLCSTRPQMMPRRQSDGDGARRPGSLTALHTATRPIPTTWLARCVVCRMPGAARGGTGGGRHRESGAPCRRCTHLGRGQACSDWPARRRRLRPGRQKDAHSGLPAAVRSRSRSAGRDARPRCAPGRR